MRPWFASEVATLVRLKAAGLSYREIGKELGRTPDNCQSRYYYHAHYGSRQVGSYTWSANDLARLTELHRAGFSRRQIADMMGKTRNAIIGKVYRLGLEFAKPAKEQARIAAAAEVLLREQKQDEAFVAREFGTKCERCNNTRQYGRTMCAECIRKTIPAKGRGWSGIGRTSGGSSLW